MLAEMKRLTERGGRVAVIVRAVDIPAWVNLPESAELRARLSVRGLLTPEPSAIKSPTTASPVAIRTRAWSLADPTSRRATASIEPSPARIARSASGAQRHCLLDLAEIGLAGSRLTWRSCRRPHAISTFAPGVCTTRTCGTRVRCIRLVPLFCFRIT